MKLTETTDFKIDRLTLTLVNNANPGSQRLEFELSTMFQELNLFENLFTPCMSGNMLILDAIGMYNVVNSPGYDKYVTVYIDKGENTPELPSYKKIFQVYKVSNVKNLNVTSKSYILHFVSPDFLKSEKLKVDQSFDGLYSNFIRTILTSSTYLNIPFATPSNGNSGIGSIVPSVGMHKLIAPKLTPFQTIEWMTYRATNEKKMPEYVFYENHMTGYNFMPLSKIVELRPYNKPLNISPKNVSPSAASEFLGARSFKVKEPYNIFDGINSGVYGGTFKGYDPLTKRRTNFQIKFSDIFDNMKHANLFPILPLLNSETLNKYNSRVVSYPFLLPRETNSWVLENDRSSTATLDNLQEYVFQRKSIFHNFMQRRIELVMPGNFGLMVGYTVQVNVPNFSNKRTGNLLDEDMSGKYIITGVRHVIRYNIHETIIEVATDSTNKRTSSTAPIDYNNPN